MAKDQRCGLWFTSQRTTLKERTLPQSVSSMRKKEKKHRNTSSLQQTSLFQKEKNFICLLEAAQLVKSLELESSFGEEKSFFLHKNKSEWKALNSANEPIYIHIFSVKKIIFVEIDLSRCIKPGNSPLDFRFLVPKDVERVGHLLESVVITNHESVFSVVR